MIRRGVYENHHLRCPVHGRVVPADREKDNGVASCGCRPIILWKTDDVGEAILHTDNIFSNWQPTTGHTATRPLLG